MVAQDNVSVRSWKSVQHFPTWSFLYSLVLTFFGWGALAVYNKLDGNISLAAGEQMYAYITLIIAWLVTARPVYALEVHEKLTSQLSELMQDLLECEKKNLGFSLLALHIATNISTRRDGNMPFKLEGDDKDLVQNNPEHKAVLKKFRTFQMQQRLALPAALHSMCVLLVFLFHVAFAPILLYANDLSTWGVLISNYILAIYTTGCLEVALLLENPYTNVYKPNTNPACTEYQNLYIELQENKVIREDETFPKFAFPHKPLPDTFNATSFKNYVYNPNTYSKL